MHTRLMTWLVPFTLLFTCMAAARAQDHGPEVRVYEGLVYSRSDGAELKLDMAIPDGAGPFPAILCIHAGGLVHGDRHEMAESIRTLAHHGYVAVTIDYRLLPAKFPAQLQDCKAAVRWLRANAANYRINPERIGALGYSTGGYLACLLGTTAAPESLDGKSNDQPSSRVQAVVSFFAPTDLTQRDWSSEVEQKVYVPYLGASFAKRPDLYRQASPIAHVAAGAPPFLLFHGDMDTVVELRHSRELADRLYSAGVDARLVVVEGAGHGWGGDKLLGTLRQMMTFFDEHLKK